MQLASSAAAGSAILQMEAGETYYANDAELLFLREKAQELVAELASLSASRHTHRLRVLASLFGALGENPEVATPIHVELGRHIFAGKNLIIGPFCVLMDAGRIQIGDNVRLDAGVQLHAVARPLDAVQRAQRLEQPADIDIGDDVWIGANAVVNPGVTIGAGTVVASGSVVMQNLPPGVQAAGNPCRVIREI